MYENHWQLSTRPFGNWFDPAFYYPSAVHQTTALKIRYAIEGRQAAVALCGECGMGKSTLVQTLLNQLPDELAPITRVVFPQLAGDQLTGYLVDKLTGTLGAATEPPRLTLARLESFLERNVASGHHALMVIEEAHLLTAPEQWETLRLLLNFGPAAQSESALTLVFVGHPTLFSLIERNRSLDERIAVKCMLQRFNPEETAAYLAHRLRVAGREADEILTADAIDVIHVRSSGIPRRINRLTDLALMVGFAEEVTRLDAEHIEGVHAELVSTTAS